MMKRMLIVLASGAAMMSAAPALAQSYTADFTKLANGTAVSNQFAGVTFSLTGGVGGSGTPLASTFWQGTMELNNSITGSYPSSAFLDAAFDTDTSSISFAFNNYGTGTTGGRGGSYYTTYDSLGGVVSTGSLNGLTYSSGPVSVAGSGIRSLVITNGTGGSDSWEFGLKSFSYTLATAAAVPEPATWGMMILGFGMAGAALRRRQAKGTALAAA